MHLQSRGSPMHRPLMYENTGWEVAKVMHFHACDCQMHDQCMQSTIAIIYKD